MPHKKPAGSKLETYRKQLNGVQLPVRDDARYARQRATGFGGAVIEPEAGR